MVEPACQWLSLRCWLTTVVSYSLVELLPSADDNCMVWLNNVGVMLEFVT